MISVELSVIITLLIIIAVEPACKLLKTYENWKDRKIAAAAHAAKEIQ